MINQKQTGATEFRTAADVAARYGIALQTLAKWRSEGRGPRFVKIGRLPRYKEADLQAWELSRTAGGEA